MVVIWYLAFFSFAAEVTKEVQAVATGTGESQIRKGRGCFRSQLKPVLHG
jgi:hypothetical protein